jgi:hypothetical protein
MYNLHETLRTQAPSLKASQGVQGMPTIRAIAPCNVMTLDLSLCLSEVEVFKVPTLLDSHDIM